MTRRSSGKTPTRVSPPSRSSRCTAGTPACEHPGFSGWKPGSRSTFGYYLIAAGEEVVALIWQRNRGRASGAAVEYEYAQVWTLRAGLVIRQRTFIRRQDALRAVGLEA